MAALLAKLNETGTRRWTTIAAFCFLVGLVLYHLVLVVGEVPFSRGSYPYYLLISKTVRDLPVLEASDEPRYVDVVGDVGPAHEAVHFCSTAPPERIFGFYSEEFAKLGFTFESRTETSVRFVAEKQAIGVGLEPEVGCWGVNLWFVED